MKSVGRPVWFTYKPSVSHQLNIITKHNYYVAADAVCQNCSNATLYFDINIIFYVLLTWI